MRVVMPLLLLPLSLAATGASGQGAPLHERFVKGTDAPAGWTLSGCPGRWEPDGPAAGRAVSVTGNGDDSGAWSFAVPWVKPGGTYRITFQARVTPGSSASTVIAGTEACNRDFSVTSQWQPYSFVFTTPAGAPPPFVRVGQWHLKGTAQFSDISLEPVAPVYRRIAGALLGEGERIDTSGYTFRAPLQAAGANSARTLAAHTATFNSNRWVFSGGSDVVYRHDLPSAQQTSGRVSLDVNYRTSGVCVVSASRDGKEWREIGRLDALGTRELDLPADLFPAHAVWLRIAGENDASGTCTFQIDQYQYHAGLDRTGGVLAGGTRFLVTERSDPRLAVLIDDLGSMGQGGADVVKLRLAPTAALRGTARVAFALEPEGGQARLFTADVPLAGRETAVQLPYSTSATGSIRATLSVRAGGKTVHSASFDEYVPPYFAADYGYPLGAIPEGSLWWCESTYKVSPYRAAPAPSAGAPGGIALSAAGRERVAAQLVLHAAADPGSLTVSATDLKGPGGARIPAAAVRIREVAYVPITTPTDRIGVAADWPDPLPPLDGAWSPAGGRNNPLWLTVTVPPGLPAGDYVGAIALRGKTARSVPLRVHVWGFSLPERTALRSGFGVSAGNIRRYHGLQDSDALAREWELYMRDFADHRMTTYNPMSLAPIGVKVTGAGADAHVALDFAAFDVAAHHYLDEMGFNAFTLGFPGLGGGRYPNYDQGSFEGVPAGTEAYDRLMTEYGRALDDHLAEKGWLDKAYVYWYDEPETTDYPFVIKGMDRLHKYAPRLKKMLTEEFQPELYGHVDLWCPITPNYSADPAHARQKLGDEVWWYVCTGPKEPYAALFIDHPAIEMRMWLWQTWKYQVQGILIWETTWWTSDSQFGSKLQDPWSDPMSYTSEKSGWWGNGDGRFFYPPRRKPGEGPAVVAEPIDSLRWEMLGEGIQDWEYFHMLDGLVKKAEAGGNGSSAVRSAKALLTVPDSICHDMTHFTTDPQPLYRHREKLAKAIEALSK